MKKFIVDTGNKKYKIEANSYDEAISAVKIIQLKDEVSPLQTVKNIEDNAIDDVFERRDFGDVRVIERSGQIEIGWPALGTVSVSNAERFLRDLQNAINYAKQFR